MYDTIVEVLSHNGNVGVVKKKKKETKNKPTKQQKMNFVSEELMKGLKMQALENWCAIIFFFALTSTVCIFALSSFI